MLDYQAEKYKNHSDSLSRIKELSSKIYNNQWLIGIDYVNKISGNISNKRYNEISKSIQLRVNSIIFHYELIHSFYSPNRKLTSANWNPMVGDQLAIRQKYMFDDIIFNSLSLFDYFSCLITYVKEANKDNWRKMWSSLVKFTRKNHEFKSTSLGLKILEIDKLWLQKLNNYRAELIHYDTGYLSVGSKWEVTQGRVDVLIKAPFQLKRIFRNLIKTEKDEDYNINSISLWIIETCFQMITELENELKEYIEQKRIIPEDKAIYTFAK